MTQTNKERVVIVELLRIVAILFIITHHLLYFTMNWDSELDALSATNIIHVNVIAFVEPFLIIGVNLFFLISGYFGIHFKVRKIIHIILVFYLYIFLLQIIGLLTGVNRFGFGFIKQTLLYIKEYWYITVYIILFLISPFLNSIIDSLNRRKMIMFVSIYIIIFCIISLKSDSLIGANKGYSVISASGIYIIGGGIKRGLMFSNPNKQIYFWSYIGLSLFNVALNLICINFLHNGNLVKTHCLVYNNPIVVFESLCFFKWFSGLQPGFSLRVSSLIKISAKSVFAVYILHSTNHVLKEFRRFPVELMMQYSWWLAFFFCFVYSIIVLIICIVIDWCIMRIAGKYIDTVSKKVETALLWCFKLVCNKMR